MARLHLIIDVTANPALWDPHEVIEDILAHADKLPTFGEGVPWFLGEGGDIQEGTFVSCEWETTSST
jgi:hypothetical protein